MTSPKKPKKRAAPPAPEVRTEGQAALLALEDSHAAIAARLGTSRQAVHQWRAGDKIPGETMRARAAEVLGIPVTAWDRTPGEAAPAPSASVPAPVEIENDEAKAVGDLIRLCVEQRSGASIACPSCGKPVATPHALTATNLRDVIKLESQLRDQRAKIVERAELSETRIVTGHPFWGRIVEVLVETLRPFPDAARAVAKALEGIGAR